MAENVLNTLYVEKQNQIDFKKDELISETSVKKMKSTLSSSFTSNNGVSFQMQMADTELERIQIKVREEISSSSSNDNADLNELDTFESKLIQAVLDFSVGGTFGESNYVINDPFNILMIIRSLYLVSNKTKLYTLSTFQSLLKKSIKNLQACAKVRLIPVLLESLPSFDNEEVADHVIDLIGDIATYSITVQELKCFFSALQRTEDFKWPPHSLKLLEILCKMSEKHGPDIYFNFSGKPGAFITIPPISRWPHQPGFTFITWLQLDAAHLSPSEQKSRPHIYCFINNRGFGYTAHFSGPMLVIEVLCKNGKKNTLLVKMKFEPQMWYHICVSHVYNRFKSSLVQVFVNGQMVTAADVSIPSSKDPVDKAFIGGSHIETSSHVFKGQMSAIYVIAEPITYNLVIALYRLGPGYKGKFKFPNELENNISETDRKLIYESKLSQNILFSYNPKAVDGELCLEASPSENASCFYQSPHALMNEGVYGVVTNSLQAAMHSLGGIQMLFPLFTQLDCPLHGQSDPEPKICSLLFGLIYDLLRGCSVFQQQLLQSQGFMIIGHLLQKSSPVHLTEATVDILLGLARFFMATPSANSLLGGLLDHVLLEPALWIKTPLSLQSNLLSLFATGYVGGLDYAGYIRKEVGVPRLVIMLRKYYSIRARDSAIENKATVEEVISLRAFVLLLVKQMIIKNQGISEDELKSILVYLAVENEEENFVDIVQLLLSVICETPTAIVPKFDEIDGFQVFFKLLVAQNSQVRICSIKILGAYMQHLKIQRKLELVEKHSFISMIGQKLSIFEMSMAMYNALFEFLIAQTTKIISEKRHPPPDSSSLMYHPSILPVISSLLLKDRFEAIATENKILAKSTNELTLVFLSDLLILLNTNNDNKRLLLQLMCWQEWLFSLAYLSPSNKDESKVTDNVFSIIKMLLHYAIQNEKEGWRVWVDTLSILHSKVSEAPKETKMPEQSLSAVDKEKETSVDNKIDESNFIESSSDLIVTTPSTEANAQQIFYKELFKENDVLNRSFVIRRVQSANNLLKPDLIECRKNRTRSMSLTDISSVIENTDPHKLIKKSVDDTQKLGNKSISVVNISMMEKHYAINSKIEKHNDEAIETNLNLSSKEETLTPEADLTSEVPTSPSKTKCRPFIDIPEFNWSQPHQKLLSELLFSIEKDIQVWKTHTRKIVSDFVSSRENSIYIMNLCHMVSILSDSLIYCCGGLLPLLSSATSPNFVNDVLEACGGMSLDTGFSFLNRILNIVDIVMFASPTNFASVETHRNIVPGGVLRQCIRLVFCGSSRNRVVCRQCECPANASALGYPRTLKETEAAIKTLIASTKPATDMDLVENIPGHMTTITNPEKLIQDSDINRLRALVYREAEDNRQSCFVSLVVIYFVAVLMVTRYRDILQYEHQVDESPKADKNPNEKSADRRVSGDSSISYSALTLEEKMEATFGTSAQLLRDILFDFSHYLSKILVGSYGQDLITEGLGSLKSEESTVELVMMLCSQEWQNALQRQAGPAFIELVDEGRKLSHSTRERIVITGSEARDILSERDSLENLTHAQFETQCTKTIILYIEQYRAYDLFYKAKKKRNASSATQCLEKIFDVLTSEYGAWPISIDSTKQYYKLDRWEDCQRRRLRLVKNPLGTAHSEAVLRPGSAEETSLEKPLALKYHLFTKQSPNGKVVEDNEDDDIDLESASEEKQAYHQHGSIMYSVACRIISPGVTLPGILTITTDSLYFTADEECVELKNIDPKILIYNDCLNVKCSFINIVAIFTRRYILQNKALEIFLANRRSFMFAFESHNIVKQVIQQLPSVGVGNSYGLAKSKSVSFSSPKQLFSKSNVCQRWQNREISNFEYLIFLNTIAGRTYNDLNQYFVFPWILKNYESSTLDLEDSNNYRDLSKPIGALNPFRLGQFVERFNTWDESSGVPPFHYGTHYSTGGFVMNWLLRLEPFASLFLSLQGGKFDHPLRTFSSIMRAWENCQKDTSDVKELIPELFYLPQIFSNSNNFVFGEGDGGKDISNVQLPPWAQSPEHFIHIHNEALESDYVSENLHKWIDLIFGYKQKGKEAEHSANVFYYLTYEGSVDIDGIVDPVTKQAIEQQIKCFGQTPSQLLTTPHPPRNTKNTSQESHKSIFLSFLVSPEVPVVHVTSYTNTPMAAIITISCNQMFSVNKWINFGGSITSFKSLKNVQIEQDPLLETVHGRYQRQLGEPLDESVTVTSSCFVVSSDNRFIFSCGYWDKSFKCFSAESGKLVQCVFGHWDVVTCLAYSDDELTSANAIIVSGSADATVLVWIWDHKRHRIIGPDDGTGHGSTPITICTGHQLPITCVDVNTSLGIIASGSIEGPCLLHSLSGELLRSLKGPAECQNPRLINISNEGRILVNYTNEHSWMAMFSINAELFHHVKLKEQNLAVVFTKDGRFFVTGGYDKCFQVWRSFEMILLSVFPPCDGSIRSLALTPDQKCLVAGLSTGSIIAMAMDFSIWPRVNKSSSTSNVNSKLTNLQNNTTGRTPEVAFSSLENSGIEDKRITDGNFQEGSNLQTETISNKNEIENTSTERLSYPEMTSELPNNFNVADKVKNPEPLTNNEPPEDLSNNKYLEDFSIDKSSEGLLNDEFPVGISNNESEKSISPNESLENFSTNQLRNLSHNEPLKDLSNNESLKSLLKSESHEDFTSNNIMLNNHSSISSIDSISSTVIQYSNGKSSSKTEEQFENVSVDQFKEELSGDQLMGQYKDFPETIKTTANLNVSSGYTTSLPDVEKINDQSNIVSSEEIPIGKLREHENSEYPEGKSVKTLLETSKIVE
ncbi:neurobeachin isoform X1 [Hydra vulgaris]|uniref:Lipopolysaccharide-responsive and beige-like anchor protein n=1 Tax=Hydra vulgaris TaxID=6087 RepID=T2MFB9_HYDVU|nr:neurobeachin [Hydra vulgaris]